jgi:hypothetical protein
LKKARPTNPSLRVLEGLARVGDEGSYYWRGSTYDSFDGIEWQQLDTLSARVPAGENTLAGSTESLAEVQSRRERRGREVTRNHLLRYDELDGRGTARAPDVHGPDRETVHRAVVPRRLIDRRDDPLGQRTTERVQ